MARIAPAFEPSTLHTEDMPAGDLINLDVAAILAHCPGVAAALGRLSARSAPKAPSDSACSN
jgi:hypothetical protein